MALAMAEHLGRRSRLVASRPLLVAASVVLVAATSQGAIGSSDRGEGAAGGAPYEPRQAAASARPNVLLIVTDDQREGTVRPQIMPRTHRALVEKGFRFTNSFITNAWCCPSRASILSGQYSHTNGVWTVGGPYGMKAWLADEESTLATWLHDAGYRTGIVGKYLNEYGAAHIPAYAPPGWDTTAMMTNLVYSVNPGYFDYRLFEDGDLVHYGRQDEDYSTRVFTRKARNFIAPGGDRPWLLYLAYTSPHGPPIYDPQDENAAPDLSYRRPANVCEKDVSDKPRFVRRVKPCRLTHKQFDRRMREQQSRMLASVDRGLGRIFADLKASGQLHNTLILLISDNGSLLGATGSTARSSPTRSRSASHCC